ncbi:MAG: hypothetical protein PHS98_00140 [Bacilli bacterium]|nr:hypothetical protein [Bacilli bacterium]MDD4643788.1 hypothetical protein [Bacilli bacterium]
MLEDYAKGQPIAYNIIKNAIVKNTVAHAYLFTADNVKEATAFALCFAKSLLCPTNNVDYNNCGNCSICHRINNNNFPELIVIESENLWIKKDELLSLKEELGMKPLEGNKRVYIISEVDKLNAHAANSILKFIEEPEPNIIAILTTSEINKVLPTIVSRCQLVSLRVNNFIDVENAKLENQPNKALIKIGQLYCKRQDDLNNFIGEAKNAEKLDAVVAFIKKYEEVGLDVLLDIKRMWTDYFLEKEEYAWAFDIMILFYKDVLNRIYNKRLEVFDYYNDAVKSVANLNDSDKIIFKLQKIILAKEKIRYNINLNMLMDKLLIEMESRECIC